MRTRTWLVALLATGVGLGCSTTSKTVVKGPMHKSATVVAEEPTDGRVPAGTVLLMAIDQELSGKTHPGDPFSGHLVSPVKTRAGTVLVPSGARVNGRVLAVESRHEKRPAQIDLDVDTIEFNGHEQPLIASIESATVKVGKSHRTAYGAVLGGIAGAALGTPVAGIGVGAALGHRSARTRVWVPRGAIFELQLREPIQSHMPSS